MESNKQVKLFEVMKAIRYISLLITLSITIFVSSCSDETMYNEKGDGEHIRISLSIPNKAIVTPLTKSGATQESANEVKSLKILVYKDGQLQENESEVYSVPDSKLQSLSDGKAAEYSLKIKSGDRKVYLIANDNLDLEDVYTIDKLEAISFINDNNSVRMIMFAGPYECNPKTNPAISASLERIYSMITVKLVKKLNQDIEIVPISLRIKNIPDRGRLLSPNKISENEVECVENGASFSDENGIDLSGNHPDATPFFLYENMQPDGKNVTNDQTKKTPADFDLDDTEEAIKTDRKCSYIEIRAKYLKGGKENVPGSGTIIYRFFLGDDPLNNFEVKRNAWYQLTLTLNGDGGKDEATWRVDTDLMDDVTLESLYIGYKVNSEAILAAENNVPFVITGIKSDVDDSSGKQFSFEKLGENGGYKIIANKTNIHDYKKQIGTITYKVGDATKTAYVYQVPRLVDPIAVYKHAKNDNPTEIVVKEYKLKGDGYPHNGYYPLISKGKWIATVEEGNWFSIGSTESAGESSIEGDGEVRFYFKPNDKNSGDPRYGKILVRYHNGNCPHEIFLRQGYDADTDIGGPKRSVFNCLGKDENGNNKITTYPTETGWFFHGGYNEAMNPYAPGYLDRGKLIWSSGNTPVHTDNNWLKNWGTDKGPCPKEYKIASVYDYNRLVTDATAYSGFIHDDSDGKGGYTRNSTDASPVGWHYDDRHNMVAEDNNYCNPAKGSLFVSNDDHATSVFFTYGKGVLERSSNNEYINEIGVGQRIKSNSTWILNYANNGNRNEAYGALYWTSTPGYSTSSSSGNRNYWGKADFWYNVKGTSYLLDNDKNEGIQGVARGNFVRCVRN